MQRLEVSGAVRPIGVKRLILIVMASSVTQINTVIRKVLSVISEHIPNTAIKHLMNSSVQGFLSGSMQQCKYWCLSLGNNKTGNVRITEYWGAFVQPLLQWKSNKCYTSSVCVSVALVMQHMPYYIVNCGLSGSTIFFHIISWSA